MNGVTSLIGTKQVAGFGVKFGAQWVLAVRSLCGMHTTGKRVTSEHVMVPGAVRMNANTTASVLRGDRKPAAVSRRARVRLPEE
ncbi:hypothetical protein GCM10027075_39880 [Streptomyces heilongjiangensis]